MSPPLSIALVEDHERLRVATAQLLRAQGHHVYELECAEDMDTVVGGDLVHLYLIDLNLPGEDGLHLAQRLRQTHPQAGLIMLTARGGAEHMSAGYQSGADVYLVKPVSPTVLLAAIVAVQRRLPGVGPATDGYRLDLSGLRLQGPAGSVELTPVEAAVLAGLMRSPRRSLDSFQISTLMGQSEDQYNKASLEIRLVRLRRKLVSVGAEPVCLRAQRGVGYQLCIAIDLL